MLIGRDYMAFQILWRETQQRLTREPRKHKGAVGSLDETVSVLEVEEVRDQRILLFSSDEDSQETRGFLCLTD
ncbi:hypothetical protein AAFF_G00191760 [Aldrovandia affinis]|uniref:Uncharacterized protein n=1 Tax=Aldrovandia affinis TaxID=143900 RepID=A0AAD7RJ63_9TELE|nr:hypothetical protein AAFF_G00191760 [Aldrovandia affinis]